MGLAHRQRALRQQGPWVTNSVQKVVIRVCMRNQKCRSKALKIAVSHPRVESASLEGPEKDQIQVIGEEIDVVQITSLLRKKIGKSEILSVEPVKEKKVEDKNEVIMMPNPIYQCYPSHYYPNYDVVTRHEPFCSIM